MGSYKKYQYNLLILLVICWFLTLKRGKSCLKLLRLIKTQTKRHLITVKVLDKACLRQQMDVHLKENRQLALIKELLKTKYSFFGFKTSELKNALSNYFRNSSQIRYELKKLISRKIVKKAKGKSFYAVTKFGLILKSPIFSSIKA